MERYMDMDARGKIDPQVAHPHERHSALARGKKIPPARAATEGMAGDRRASAMT